MELCDIHCHLMPYVDDGAADLTESLELLREEAAQGIRHICVTPHLRGGMFRSTDDAVRTGFAAMQEQVRQEALPLTLHLSREYYYDSDFVRLLRQHAMIPMGPSDVILTEFSYATPREKFSQAARQLHEAGYIPMFAHVERYRAVQQEPELIRELAEYGVIIQVNAASILRKEGWHTWLTVHKLLRNGYVHVVASDAHNMANRKLLLGDCAASLEKKYGAEDAQRMLYDNPHKILYGV